MAIWKYFIRNVLKCYSSCEEHNSRPILSLVSRALLSLATSVQLHREIVAQQSSFSRSCTPLNQQSVPPPVQQCNSPRAGGRDIFPIALISRKLSQFWRGRSGLVWLFCSSNIHLENYTVIQDHSENLSLREYCNAKSSIQMGATNNHGITPPNLYVKMKMVPGFSIAICWRFWWP